ncbi:MAG TPA: hypothetical protein VF336_00375, partial [Syntrophales bacterium]
AFLTMADLGRAILLSMSKPVAAGQVYNLGSLFLSWKEIADIIIGLTESTSAIQPIASEKWRGAAFLNEVWDLDWSKAGQEIGYEPADSVETMKGSFAEAMKSCVAQVRNEEKQS